MQLVVSYMELTKAVTKEARRRSCPLVAVLEQLMDESDGPRGMVEMLHQLDVEGLKLVAVCPYGSTWAKELDKANAGVGEVIFEVYYEPKDDDDNTIPQEVGDIKLRGEDIIFVTELLVLGRKELLVAGQLMDWLDTYAKSLVGTVAINQIIDEIWKGEIAYNDLFGIQVPNDTKVVVDEFEGPSDPAKYAINSGFIKDALIDTFEL